MAWGDYEFEDENGEHVGYGNDTMGHITETSQNGEDYYSGTDDSLRQHNFGATGFAFTCDYSERINYSGFCGGSNTYRRYTTGLISMLTDAPRW